LKKSLRWARSSPGAEENVRDILAILLQGAVPEPIGHLISEHDGFADYFDPDSIPVRVILALRSDYVYALNRWRRHLPALSQNSLDFAPCAVPVRLKPSLSLANFAAIIVAKSKKRTEPKLGCNRSSPRRLRNA
jgi:hypothetical protein